MHSISRVVASASNFKICLKTRSYLALSPAHGTARIRCSRSFQETAFLQPRKTISPRAPGTLSQIAILLVGMSLLTATALSQPAPDASLSGTVRGPDASPVTDAILHLKSNNSSEVMTAETDAQGKYTFSSLLDGVYQLSASKNGFQDATIPSIFLAN